MMTSFVQARHGSLCLAHLNSHIDLESKPSELTVPVVSAAIWPSLAAIAVTLAAVEAPALAHVLLPVASHELDLSILRSYAPRFEIPVTCELDGPVPL